MALTRLGPNQSINLATNVTGTLATGNGGTGATSFSPGKILQIIGAETSTETSSSSTTYADTSLTATITPSSASSKILVLVHQTSIMKNSSDNGGKLQLLRGSSALKMFENDFGRDGSSGLNIVGGTGIVYLDSPSTTSATTYKTQLACSVTAAASIVVQHNNSVSTMTLMEVSA